MMPRFWQFGRSWESNCKSWVVGRSTLLCFAIQNISHWFFPVSVYFQVEQILFRNASAFDRTSEDEQFSQRIRPLRHKYPTYCIQKVTYYSLFPQRDEVGHWCYKLNTQALKGTETNKFLHPSANVRHQYDQPLDLIQWTLLTLTSQYREGPQFIEYIKIN